MFILTLASFVVGSWVEQWPSLSPGNQVMTVTPGDTRDDNVAQLPGCPSHRDRQHICDTDGDGYSLLNTLHTLRCPHRNNITNVIISVILTAAPEHVTMS